MQQIASAEFRIFEIDNFELATPTPAAWIEIFERRLPLWVNNSNSRTLRTSRLRHQTCSLTGASHCRGLRSRPSLQCEFQGQSTWSLAWFISVAFWVCLELVGARQRRHNRASSHLRLCATNIPLKFCRSDPLLPTILEVSRWCVLLLRIVVQDAMSEVLRALCEDLRVLLLGSFATYSLFLCGSVWDNNVCFFFSMVLSFHSSVEFHVPGQLRATHPQPIHPKASRTSECTFDKRLCDVLWRDMPAVWQVGHDNCLVWLVSVHFHVITLMISWLFFKSHADDSLVHCDQASVRLLPFHDVGWRHRSETRCCYRRDCKSLCTKDNKTVFLNSFPLDFR